MKNTVTTFSGKKANAKTQVNFAGSGTVPIGKLGADARLYHGSSRILQTGVVMSSSAGVTISATTSKYTSSSTGYSVSSYGAGNVPDSTLREMIYKYGWSTLDLYTYN